MYSRQCCGYIFFFTYISLDCRSLSSMYKADVWTMQNMISRDISRLRMLDVWRQNHVTWSNMADGLRWFRRRWPGDFRPGRSQSPAADDLSHYTLHWRRCRIIYRHLLLLLLPSETEDSIMWDNAAAQLHAAADVAHVYIDDTQLALLGIVCITACVNCRRQNATS